MPYPDYVDLSLLDISGISAASDAGASVVGASLGGLELDANARLSLALSRFLDRGSPTAESACLADLNPRRAAMRSSGVASRIRRLLRVFWR